MSFDICDFLPNISTIQWNWTAINAVGTVLIGLIAGWIAYKQYRIEKHKKDDFLFEHRLNLYAELSKVLSGLAYELGKVAVIKKADDIFKEHEIPDEQKDDFNCVLKMCYSMHDYEAFQEHLSKLLFLSKQVRILFSQHKKITERLTKIHSLGACIDNQFFFCERLQSVECIEKPKMEKEIEALKELLFEPDWLEKLCEKELRLKD